MYPQVRDPAKVIVFLRQQNAQSDRRSPLARALVEELRRRGCPASVLSGLRHQRRPVPAAFSLPAPTDDARSEPLSWDGFGGFLAAKVCGPHGSRESIGVYARGRDLARFVEVAAIAISRSGRFSDDEPAQHSRELELVLAEICNTVPEPRPLSRRILLARLQGLSCAAVARHLSRSRTTVARYLREDFLQPLGARNVQDLLRLSVTQREQRFVGP